MNSVHLIGRVGRDAEVRHTPDGGTVISFSLATSERWTDSKGEKKERTTWHQVEYWNDKAKAIAEYITKGRELAVEGSIRIDEWEKDGEKKSKAKIRARRMHFIGGKPQADGAAPQGGNDDDVPF